MENQNQQNSSQPTENKHHHCISLIVLDQSGSMSHLAPFIEETMHGIIRDLQDNMNEFPSIHQYLNTWTFEGTHIQEQIPLTQLEHGAIPESKPFRAGGSTPLFDALGESLGKLEAYIRSTPHLENAKVVVSIITDGMENSSRSFTGAEIRRTINRLKLGGWEFQYYGTDHDIAAAADSLNIDMAKRFHWDKSGDGLENLRHERGRQMKSVYYNIIADDVWTGEK
jgi:hypothetical protein